MRKLTITGLENIAAEVGCSKKTLYKWIRVRDFPACKIDGVWRAMAREIEEWFVRQRLAATGGDMRAQGGRA